MRKFPLYRSGARSRGGGVTNGGGNGSGGHQGQSGVLAGTNPSGVFSMSRVLKGGYGGSLYTNTSGNVSTLFDQSGSARDATQGTGSLRPAVATGGPNSRACADFDGVDDVLTTALASSTFLDVGGGYVIAAALIDAVTANSFSKGNLQPLFGDASAIIALGVGNQYQGGAYNDDGTNDFPTIDQCAAGGCYVFEWLHTGGNLTIRRNGNVSASVASGNSSSLAGNRIRSCGGNTPAVTPLLTSTKSISLPASPNRTSCRVTARRGAFRSSSPTSSRLFRAAAWTYPPSPSSR
jgi:hypothetical protein